MLVLFLECFDNIIFITILLKSNEVYWQQHDLTIQFFLFQLTLRSIIYCSFSLSFLLSFKNSLSWTMPLLCHCSINLLIIVLNKKLHKLLFLLNFVKNSFKPKYLKFLTCQEMVQLKRLTVLFFRLIRHCKSYFGQDKIK